MKKPRVIVGMSGGVDSSVCAGLLKKRGYDVIGITMQLLQKDSEKESACCNINSINDARRVSNQIGIPHYTINLRNPFQEKVIDHFVSSYVDGMTPNPCVECNRHIKFDEMEKTAKELGADYVATGHYVKVEKRLGDEYALYKGADETKDQSYFLYMMNQEQLSKTLFPLGRYKKSEVRQMAEDMNLINADKKDSQEICFVTQDSYKSFIKDQLGDEKTRPGKIVDTAGVHLGTHDGVYQFTIGQRKGLNIASQTPKYVLKINSQTQEVVVGDRHELTHKNITCSNFSLVNGSTLTNEIYDFKLRYLMTPIRGKILKVQPNGTANIQLLTPQPFITPGQSAVAYKGTRVVGGGIITSSSAS